MGRRWAVAWSPPSPGLQSSPPVQPSPVQSRPVQSSPVESTRVESRQSRQSIQAASPAIESRQPTNLVRMAQSSQSVREGSILRDERVEGPNPAAAASMEGQAHHRAGRVRWSEERRGRLCRAATAPVTLGQTTPGSPRELGSAREWSAGVGPLQRRKFPSPVGRMYRGFRV